MRQFVEWLSFHPSTEEIARALVTDFLSDFNVHGIRFGCLNKDDSIVILGQFGYADADHYRERVIPGSEWRKIDNHDIRIIAGRTQIKWSPDQKMYVNPLREHGVILGYLIVEFTEPFEPSRVTGVEEVLDELSVAISLYLSLQNHRSRAIEDMTLRKNHSRRIELSEFSPRQLQILRGMVEGKTNHQLATEMGFSVSTVRHETMRIFRMLGVSGRGEAATKAMELQLT